MSVGPSAPVCPSPGHAAADIHRCPQPQPPPALSTVAREKIRTCDLLARTRAQGKYRPRNRRFRGPLPPQPLHPHRLLRQSSVSRLLPYPLSRRLHLSCSHRPRKTPPTHAIRETQEIASKRMPSHLHKSLAQQGHSRAQHSSEFESSREAQGRFPHPTEAARDTELYLRLSAA